MSYFQLYRNASRYRWWKPLLATLLAAVMSLSASALVGIAALAVLTAETGATPTTAEVNALLVPDVARPISLVLSLAVVALWIPCIFFALWAVGLKPVGMLNSVTFKLRWIPMRHALVAALVIVAAAQAVSVVSVLVSGTAAESQVTLDTGTVLFSLAAILLLVPLQAAAEEYAFRGMLAQTLGSWFRGPLVPMLVPTLIFMLLHVYDIWGMLEVFALGLTAAWLTYRTGGLEAAIALHVVNNISVFILLLSGVFRATSMSPDAGSPISLVLTVVMLAAYSAWVLRANRTPTQGELA